MWKGTVKCPNFAYESVILYSQNSKGFDQVSKTIKIIKGLPWLPGLPWKHEKSALTL